MIREFDYYAPDTIEDALRLLELKEGQVSLLAGGTDLIVNMKKNLFHPDHIIDIKGIEEFSRLEYDEKGLFIGATVTVNQLIHDNTVQEKYPLLVEAARTLGSYQIRNRATVVGNICNASPGADMAPVLLVQGTRVLIQGTNEKREVLLEDFFTGVKKTLLKENEIVVGLVVSPGRMDDRGKYMKKSRIKGPDLSTVGVAGLVSKSNNIARFAYGAVAPTPVLLDFSELVYNTDFDSDTLLNKMYSNIEANINPISDVRSTEKYRLRMAKVYTKRIFSLIWEEGDLL